MNCRDIKPLHERTMGVPDGNWFSLLRSGLVTRYHIVPSNTQQNVACHSWGVAMFYVELCRTEDHPECLAGVMLALTHDCSELFTGDLPANVKWANERLAEELKNVEKSIDDALGVTGWREQCSPRTIELVKIADMLELIWWSIHMINLGNVEYVTSMERGIQFLKDKRWMTDRVADMISLMQYKTKGGIQWNT